MGEQSKTKYRLSVHLPLDILDYCSDKYYPTPKAWLDEAHSVGACRRVGYVPDDVIMGKSRVFMLHNKAIPIRKRGKIIGYQAGVFAYFTIQGITYIVKDMTHQEITEEFKVRGVTQFSYMSGGGMSRAGMPARKCGSLEVGGIYLLSETDMEKVKDLADSSALSGGITEIKPPVPYHTTERRVAFRGHRYIKGSQVLERRPTRDWWVSKEFRAEWRKLIKRQVRKNKHYATA
jgi:hypothetical protein